MPPSFTPHARARIGGAPSPLTSKRIQQAILRLRASHHHLPQSLLGQAIDYTLGQRPTLETLLADGRVEIDNNLVKNAIGPTAISKKNWTFIGAGEAGQRSPIIDTIIESCRRRGINPFAYLRDALPRLPPLTNRQIPEVAPGPKPSVSPNAGPHHNRQSIDL